MIVKKFLNFINKIQEIDGHKVVFSTSDNGVIWHEFSNLSPDEGFYFMMLNNQIISKTENPSLICPLENSSIFSMNKDSFDIGNYVYYDSINNVLINIEPPPTSLHVKYNGSKWEIVATLEEQIKYYENKVIEKTKELESLRLAGFEGTLKFFNLEIEIVELRKKYLDANHELALQIDNKLRGA
ncbi:hypothetical protein [Cetobacterium sp. ZWU0022]|uniref:hypothetical protein n=1 Tax=Cetobacterium sp. ZWU0022 TaxID=1340502 RepID=UPI000646F185|nr:hypothetical protein [Cetobacterium sp. ZWU0022]